MNKLSRRGFIGGLGAVVAAGAAGSLAACSPNDIEMQTSDTAEVTNTAPPTHIDEELTCDIVIVGAGCSGLAACVHAAEAGKKIICIDELGVVGGSSGGVEGLFAVGSRFQQEQGIDVSMGEMVRTEMTQNQFRIKSLVLRDLIEASGENIGWLADHGVRFGQIDNYVGKHPIFHWYETGTGQESYIPPMQDSAENAGVEFILETSAESLIQADDGSVIGLYAKKSEGSILQVNAKAVILATGGYAERIDYLTQFGYTEENTIAGGMYGNGSGHEMAISCGSASYMSNSGILGSITVAGLPAFYDGGYFNQVMQPVTGVASAIWVNESGDRFVNEDLTLDNPMVGANPTRQHDKVFILLDEAMMTEYVNGDEQGLNELEYALDQGIIIGASSWSELASETGMDSDVLDSTITRYNENCALGDDRDCGKASDYLKAYSSQGKVYAILTKNSVGKTIGSVQTDRNFSAIDENGEPIVGLYVVGVEGAMIWASVYTMNISGSCGAHNIFSGRTAAQHAIDTLL